ncbi:Crp/Fnr family transcriptional regulator [Geothermobacter hydrogeniphilus]|nr:Crp/Fnr family transcriptional regulator [Geothermobacter hydrogeniphilus]
MTTDIELFRDGLLKDLATDEAEAFLGRCRRKNYPDGRMLFAEQTEADHLYLLISGRIDLQFELPAQKGTATLVTRSPGDAVGWSTMVPPHRYRFAAVCVGPTTVLEIDRPTLQSLFYTNYHLAYIFMRNIAVLSGDRLLRVQEKLATVLGDEAVNGW